MRNLFFTTGLYWIWLAPIIIVIDFISKQWVMHNLLLYEIRTIMPSFNLFYAHNYGAAFGFLSDKGGWQCWFFISVTVIIVIVLLVIMIRTSANQKLNNISYSLIVGGALGNLIDRTVYGFVVDFIDFYIGSWHFATFNIADLSICIGTMLAVLESFFISFEKHDKQNSNKV